MIFLTLQFLSKRVTCLLILLLFACANISSADDILGQGWINDVPAQMPTSVSSGSQSVMPSPSQTGTQTQPLISPLALVSGPSATAITPELQALANGLNNDPLRIFNYVHNKIAFQAYYGSNKGAQGAYLDGAGNDMDQASLLIALLNQAGYATTSYVYGTYSVQDTSWDGNDLVHWLGTTTALAPNILATGNIPVYTGADYGIYIVWPFDHVWVRVTINGTTYDLDPSYKTSQIYSAIDFKTNSGYSRSQLLTDATGSATADYAQNLSRTNLESRFSQYASTLRTYIKANNPNTDLNQIIGGTRIQEQTITDLSQGAPLWEFSPTVTTTFTSIPTQYIATYRVQAGTQIDSTFNADSLQGNRLSLVFSSNNAQVWFGDTLVAQETSASGTSISVTLSLSHPKSAGFKTQILQPVTYLRTGNYDLTYSYFPNPLSNGQIDASNRRLQNYLASGLTDTSRQVLTETLHSLGLKWARRVSIVSLVTQQIRNGYSQIFHIFGRTGQEAGYYVDMPGVLTAAMDSQGNMDTIGFNTIAYLMSAMEHGVIEQNGGIASVSTIKCLALANDGHQKIFKATSSNNSSTVAPALSNYSAAQLASFTSSINSGYTLLLHQNGNTGLNKWAGFGYAGMSGSMVQMIIAGGYSGGYATEPIWLSGADDTQTTYASTNVPNITPPSVAPTLSLEPVDLLTGAFTFEHTDLTLGLQNSPRGLNFTRYYDSSRNFQTSALGNGWRHSCEGKVTLSSELDMAFGLTQPTDAVQTIIGALAVTDFVNTSLTPKELLIGALAANWTVNRSTNNVANVQLGNQRFSYVNQPDGTWNPPPGSTTALTGSSGTFALQPRFGGSVVFDGSNRVSQWIDVDNNTETWNYNLNGTLDTLVDKHYRSLKFNYYTSGVGSGLLQNVTDSTGRSVQFAYTSGSYSGANLSLVTDPQGFQKTFVYDGRNRLTDLKDSALAFITHNDYDSLDRVYQQLSQNLSNHKWQFLYSPGMTLEIDPQGGTTTHLFDSKNRNAGTVDALGNTTSVGYDSQNHVTQSVDATGRQTTAIYDANQNPSTISITGTDGSVKTTTYYFDSSLRLWKVYDPTGRYTENGYDSKNHLISTWDAGRRLTQYFYRIDGLLDHVIDPSGYTTSYTVYDSHGNPTTVIRGDGTTTTATFNVFGDSLTSTDGRGKTTTYTYDNRRLPSTRLDALGNTTTWVYDSNGYLQSVTDRNNHTVSTPCDNLGHVQSKTAVDTAAVTYGYDPRDWQTTVTDGLGHATTTNFDAAGRQISTVNALAITTGSTVYDSAGRACIQYDGLNHATHYFYDGVGRLDHSVDPINHTVYNSYDDAGRALTLQNRRGLTFGFGYSTDGLPSTLAYPSGRQSQIAARESGGLPKTLQSPSGNQTSLTYDGIKRTKTQTDGVGSITWIYDGEGNATDVVEASGSTHRVFDELSRIKSCTDIQGNTVGYGYDNERNITSITYPGGKAVTYTYDGSNRLKTVTDWAGRLTTYYYDIAGRLDHVVRPNNTRQRVNFDNANRLAHTYEEQLSGINVVATIWQAGYGFDNANRLSSFTPTPAGKTFAPPVTTMTYDADNRIATYNGQTVSNDQDGNMLTAPVNGTLLAAMTYDKRNRLTSAGGITYTYDAENRRISSTTGGQTTRYIYSRGGSLDRLLAKLNPDGSTTRYVYGTGLLYEETTSASGSASPAVYYHFDWRGDTVALSDPSGNVTARLSYSPYGERTIESGTVSTPFCFNGKWGVITEQSGLLYMQARFYSPVMRRFLNEDPSGFNGGSNLHVYADGNPIDFMDPYGLGPVQTNDGGITGGIMGFGGELEKAGIIRDNYNAYVSSLDATSGYDPLRSAGRSFFNQPENSTPLSQGIALMYRWEQGNVTQSLANNTVTSAAVNNAAAMAKWGGRGIVVVGVASSIYTVATAPDPYRATAQVSSSFIVGTGGSIGGVALGAAIGSLFGPGPGTAIGAFVGGVVVGGAGGVSGNHLGAAAYDSINGSH